MYIGIKTLLLIAKGYGDFYVPACDTDTPDAQIKKIILCGRGKEKVIYNIASQTEYLPRPLPERWVNPNRLMNE